MDVLTTTKFWDSEISKSVDFNYGAMSSINTLHALYQGLFAEAVNSFVLSGMTIVQATPPSMNVAIKPGLLFSRIENKLLHLGNDLVASVDPADLAAGRIDTLEVRYCVQDIDVASRAFKDPITGTVTYNDVETKTQACIEARVVPGVPGSGVAPNTEAGWTKLAEVEVHAGATQIITTNIKPVTAVADGEETAAWTTEKSFTFSLTSVSAIKTMILAHMRNNITDQNTVHGIRQGSGNGFDADKVDGIEGVDIVKRLTKSTGSVSDCVLNSWTICSSNVTGLPTTGAYYNVLTVGDATNSQQLAIHLSSRGYIYTRLKDSGTWGDWCVLWSSQNDGAGSGLDADTLDGRQASSFVYDNPAAITSGSVIDAFTHSGMYLSILGATDTPMPGNFCYFVNRYDSNSGAIKAVNYVSGQEWTGWIVGGVFMGWTPVWNAVNDGYGSGLDADLVRGTTPGTRGLAYLASAAVANIAALILSDLKTVDGSGSGLDADLVRGTTPGAGGLAALAKAVTIWASDNDGAGSGLDADTLDGVQLNLIALLNSPAFTGTPTAPSPDTGAYTTQIATAAFVKDAIRNARYNEYFTLDGRARQKGPVSFGMRIVSMQLLSGVDYPSMAKLDRNLFALYAPGLGQIRAYRWDGTQFTQVGSSFALTGTGWPTMCSLGTNRIALMGSDNHSLRCYTFNGSTFSLTGTAVTISGSGIPTLCNVNSDTVALLLHGNKRLYRYTFNGSTWSMVGTQSAQEVTNVSTAGMAQMDNGDILILGGGSKRWFKYRWVSTYYNQVLYGSSNDVDFPALVNVGNNVIFMCDELLNRVHLVSAAYNEETLVVTTSAISDQIVRQINQSNTISLGACAAELIDDCTVAFIDGFNDQLCAIALS